VCCVSIWLVYINQERCQVKCKKISDARREAWEERAAIIEVRVRELDGGAEA